MTKKLPPLNIRLIVNPAAGRGRARKALDRIKRAFAAERIVDIAFTEKAGDEARLAIDALNAGVETIVAVGGDGTCSRIAAAIVEVGSSCRLGVVPAGTGNDFAKTLGVADKSVSQIARLCAGSSIARMDVGKIGEFHFLNGCGFGIDPEILAATLSVTWLRGNAVYIVSALKKLFTYRGFNLIDRENPDAAELQMMLTVSNGRSLGGAFQIAPLASVCDGLLDVHVFGDTTPLKRLKLFLAAFAGRHPQMAEVRFQRRAGISLAFDSPPKIEIDGELRKAPDSTVWIECIPGALSVVAAPGFPL